MAEVVRHRGPDGEGHVIFAGPELTPFVFGGVDTPQACFADARPFLPRSRTMPTLADVRIALAHRRLAIVDLTPGGHQPMSDEGGDHWVIYNGEIYNHVELRGELEARGHRFFSHSDTEVLLAAYREWGEECLERLNGMFAFVLIDRRRGKLVAARDRFGVKPLYYWWGPDGALAIASEMAGVAERRTRARLPCAGRHRPYKRDAVLGRRAAARR